MPFFNPSLLGPRASFVMAFLFVVLPACSTTVTAAVNDYETERGLDYADCGGTTVTCPDEGTADANVAVRDCILSAFADCRPAEARFHSSTDEGDPIPITILVEPGPSGDCRAIEFMDTREDEFGPQELTRAECTTLSKNECTGVVADGCTTVEAY